MMRAGALVLLSLLAFGDAAKGVFDATDATFQPQVVDSGKNAFVKFLAPW